MDFSKVLKCLPTLTRREPPEVSEADLLAKANAMARRGYIHNETSLKALEAYMQGYGVLLSGGVGIGKTMFFRKVNPEPIALLSFNQCHLWTFDNLGEFIDSTINQELVLDDIGWNSEARNYGQRFETLQVVLDCRLNNSRCRTHITTNMTNDELCEKFDGHLVDRIYQACKCFRYPPNIESKRDADINWQYLKNEAYAKEQGRQEL